MENILYPLIPPTGNAFSDRIQFEKQIRPETSDNQCPIDVSVILVIYASKWVVYVRICGRRARLTDWVGEGAKDQAQIMKRNSNQGSASAPGVHAEMEIVIFVSEHVQPWKHFRVQRTCNGLWSLVDYINYFSTDPCQNHPPVSGQYCAEMHIAS